jgi:hypothetical protein
MSLTISYRGNLRDPNATEILLGDVFDLCMEMGWFYMPVHRSNIMPAKGIMITPQGCETILLTFLTNGKLYDPTHFIYTEHPEKEIINEEMHEWIHVKTRYAGVDTHIAIIKFFRYLGAKYFETLEFNDPSGYWETGNVADCFEHFGEFADPFDFEGEFLEDDDDIASASSRMDEALWNRGAPEIRLN